MSSAKKTLENTEGAIRNGQSRVTDNIDETIKKQHNMCSSSSSSLHFWPSFTTEDYWPSAVEHHATIRKQTQIT